MRRTAGAQEMFAKPKSEKKKTRMFLSAFKLKNLIENAGTGKAPSLASPTSPQTLGHIGKLKPVHKKGIGTSSCLEAGVEMRNQEPLLYLSLHPCGMEVEVQSDQLTVSRPKTKRCSHAPLFAQGSGR